MASYEERQVVPAELRDWSIAYDSYAPVDYTDEVVLTSGVEKGWADPEDPTTIDFSQRISYEGQIHLDKIGRPLNPRGRTGLVGRGLLGKWGPNQAADPIVFAPSKVGELCVLLVQRKDTGAWALPGGMVDSGERVSSTVRRELKEETGVDADTEEFHEVYRGYVEDPRNTDNAWMETIASYALLGTTIEANAGDDAVAAQWKPVTTALAEPMYANHTDFVSRAYNKIISQKS